MPTFGAYIILMPTFGAYLILVPNFGAYFVDTFGDYFDAYFWCLFNSGA